MVKNYVQKTNVNVIEWPAQSPDINLFDKLSGELRIRKTSSSYPAKMIHNCLRALFHTNLLSDMKFKNVIIIQFTNLYTVYVEGGSQFLMLQPGQHSHHYMMNFTQPPHC